MKKFIFLRNKLYRPSSYYRIYQYIEDEKTTNICISEYECNNFYTSNIKNKLFKLAIFSFFVGYIRRIYFIIKILIRESDYEVIVQREIFPKYCGGIGRVILRKLFKNASHIKWDFDDNILNGNEISLYEFKLLEDVADCIIVGNNYLRNLLNDNAKKKSIIVNTTDKVFEDIELEKVLNIRKELYRNSLNLLWVGTKGNLKFLETIIPFLDEVSKEIDKEVVLKVISDGKVNYKCKNLVLINIKWEREKVLEEMKTSHIGFMPLEDNKLTRGKCSFKAVQYMGYGMSVLLSPVGLNKNIVKNGFNGYLCDNKDEWIKNLKKLSNDWNKVEIMSINSRRVWEEKFNPKEIKKYIFN